MNGTDYLQELRFLNSISEEAKTTSNKDYHDIICMNKGYMIMRNSLNFHISIGEFEGKFFLRESELNDVMHEIRKGDITILYDEEDNLVQISIDGTDYAKTLKCLPKEGIEDLFKLPKKRTDLGILPEALVDEMLIASSIFDFTERYNLKNMFAFGNTGMISASCGYMVYHSSYKSPLDFTGTINPEFGKGLEHFHGELTAQLCGDSDKEYLRIYDGSRFGLYHCRPGEVGTANKLNGVNDTNCTLSVEVKTSTLFNYIEKLSKEMKKDARGYQKIYLLFEPADGLVVLSGQKKGEIDELIIESTEMPEVKEVISLDVSPFKKILEHLDTETVILSCQPTDIRLTTPLFINGQFGLAPMDVYDDKMYDMFKFEE